MRTTTELFRLLGRLWNTGNAILRIAAVIVIADIFLVVAASLLGVSWLTAMVAVYLTLATAFFALVAVDPLLFGVIALREEGRVTLKRVVGILAFELLLFIYFSIIPVDAIRYLIPVVLLLVLGIFFSTLSGGTAKKFVPVLSLLLTGITLLFVFAHFRPQTFASLSVWNERADKRDATAILDTTITNTTPTSTVVSSAAVNKSRKTDLYHVDITPPTQGWSEEVNLFTLKPFRSKYGFRVTDSVRVKFHNGRDMVVGPADSLKNLGNGPAIFRVQALRANTLVVAEAYNPQ